MFRDYLTIFLFASSPIAIGAESSTPSAEINQVDIQLFGQPCALSGPYSKPVLSAIHAIGPEQIPASPDAASAKKATEKLQGAHDIPVALDPYREKFVRRLAAQTEFFAALEAARKSQSTTSLAQVAEKNMNARRLPSFQSALRAQEKKVKTPATWPAPVVQSLYSIYNDGIEPNPEKDFHDITEKRMKLKYACWLGDAEGE